MFKINDNEIKQFEADLQTCGRKAIPYAVRNTLNNAAFETQKIARNDIQTKMITRNKFTVQSVQVDMARSLEIKRAAATVGSILPYMEDQEFGATKKKSGKQGVPIATSYSAGQGQGTQPRTRLPRKPNRMANIQLKRRRGRASSRKQQNLIAIREAATAGSKYVFLDLGRRKGIFKVVGGKRRPKIKMVWSLENQSVRIPANPWLKPAFDRGLLLIPEFYKQSLQFQIKRLGIF